MRGSVHGAADPEASHRTLQWGDLMTLASGWLGVGGWDGWGGRAGGWLGEGGAVRCGSLRLPQAACCRQATIPPWCRCPGPAHALPCPAPPAPQLLVESRVSHRDPPLQEDDTDFYRQTAMKDPSQVRGRAWAASCSSRRRLPALLLASGAALVRMERVACLPDCRAGAC